MFQGFALLQLTIVPQLKKPSLFRNAHLPFPKEFLFLASFLRSFFISDFFSYINLLYLQFTTEGCGQTKGCYASPASCTSSENCDFLVTYNATNSTHVEFELSGKGDWIAVGFSDNRFMVSYYVSRMHFYVFVILLFPCSSLDVTLGKFHHSYTLNCTQNEIIQRAIDN